MKDLDFDELDKAVNSLMTNVPKANPSQKQDDDAAEKTLDITPTLSENDTPSFDKLDMAAAAAVSEAAPLNDQKQDVVADVSSAMQPTPPATRRGGRFMDVVHPSSDMKKTVVPTRPVSRQGVTIDPGVRSSTPEVTRSTPTATEEPVYTPYEAPAAPVEEKAAPANNEWPDPLAMDDFKDDTLPKEEEWSAPAEDGPLPVSYPDESETPPLTSPFLLDTKVEKRPLGSGNDMLALLEEPEDEEPVKEEPKQHDDKTVHDPSDQLPALPKDVEPLLPEELQGDLMAVEADTHMGMPKTDDAHVAAKPSESAVPVVSEPSAVEPSQTPVGPPSIPQQYREEPSTGDQQSGGIYDTETYHQPLAHAAKKKSGWMWVVWIIVILLVGAGSGAALYFLNII